MATVIAAESEITNFTADISGEELVSLNEAIEQIEQSLGFSIKKTHEPRQLGDQSISKGDNSVAQDLLGWKNEISFAKGIAEQVNAAKSIASVG
jgi:nucleoside-diphosphate-sugar epimerase